MTTRTGPVVVGTDFSAGSAMALREAQALAARLGVGLHVVHVADGVGGETWEEPAAAVRWLTAAGLQLSDLIVRFGRAWVELARYAGEVGPSLLVVGSHGVSGYQPLDLGATAARLSLHARCPVTIVSPRSETQPVVQWKANAAGRGCGGVAREAGDQQLTGETR